MSAQTLADGRPGVPLTVSDSVNHRVGLRGRTIEASAAVGEGPELSLAPVLAPKKQSDPLQVLCIDDEPPVVWAMARLLSRLDCQATIAITPEDIHARLAELPKWDVIVTDWQMPGISGQRVVELVHAQSPETPVVQCSGYLGAVEFPRGPGDVFRLPKPFSAADVARILAEVRRQRDAMRLASSIGTPPG